MTLSRRLDSWQNRSSQIVALVDCESSGGCQSDQCTCVKLRLQASLVAFIRLSRPCEVSSTFNLCSVQSFHLSSYQAACSLVCLLAQRTIIC